MRWLEPDPVEVLAALRSAIGGHPLVAETLVRRGYAEVEAALAFLDPDRYHPAPASNLPDLSKAVSRLVTAIKHKERILVWGDFDVDGQTSTTILVSALQKLGADVGYHIPVRETESHGITVWKLKDYLNEGFSILLTCDTGVSAHEAVTLATANGLDVIVTDHHELPEELPKAYAVVNPRRLHEGHPLRELPGVGTAFKLVEGLYDWYGLQADLPQFLDLVALGIVADVAVQRRDTRHLLQRGLIALRATQRLGLLTLLENARLEAAHLTEGDIGFAIAPRLNALGRLADASPIVEFLTSSDLTRVRIQASQLESLNEQRKLLQDQVYGAAMAQLDRDPSLLDPYVIVLSHPTWPAGVNGLVAGRMASELYRPVILLTSPPGEPARGSARSPEGINITQAIAEHADLLQNYGGHAGAAGLALDPERIPGFRRSLSATIRRLLRDEVLEPTLRVDAFVPLSDLSLDLVRDLSRMAPFGSGNPPIMLATETLRVVSQSALGRSGDHVELTVQDTDGLSQRVIRWRGGSETTPEGYFDLAYSISVNEFRGERDLRLTWLDARPTQIPEVELARKTIELIDWRGSPNPLEALEGILAEGPAQVWAEAAAPPPPQARDRSKLEPAETLVIWTSPPSLEVLSEAVDQARPRRIHVFGIEPSAGDASAFLQQLAGLAKHAIRRSVETSYAELAAASGQTEPVVRKGLDWLKAKGYTTVRDSGDGLLSLTEGGGGDEALTERLTKEVRDLFREVSAYRRYFAHAEIRSLIPREGRTAAWG